ncbi:MAG: hypothetical protein Q4G65_16595 [bacterium]|nr:hypothetical protein [bacterium]
MKKMTFALACASTAALFADMAPLAGFENYANDAHVADAVEPGSQSVYWLYNGASGSTDGSEVKEFGTVPGYPNVDFGEKYLNLSTEGGTLWRSINEGDTQKEGAAKLGTAQTVPADTGIYIDTMVQFTPTEDGGEPTLDPADKIAIWLDVKAGENGAPSMTNLCARARFLNYADDVVSEAATFTLEPVEGALVLDDATAWHRLTIKAYTLLDDANQRVSAFEIKVDGTAMKAKTSPIGAGMQEMWAEILSAEQKSLVEADRLFPSLEGIAAAGSTFAIQGLGFKGSGAIDNVQFSYTDPNPEAPAGGIDFTITAAEGMEKVEWSADDGQTWTTYDAATATAEAGTIKIRLTNADGAVKIVEKTLSSTDKAFDVSDATFGWAEYLGAADADGAYVIDNEAELNTFAAKAAEFGTDGETFKLGADITLTAPWSGVGIRTAASKQYAANGATELSDFTASAKDLVSWTVAGTEVKKGYVTQAVGDARKVAYLAGAFRGTFDGGDHTISGVSLVKGDYVGFFNSTYGATIKNLKLAISGTGFADSATEDFGGGVVAGVTVDTTIQDCETVAGGTFTGSKAVAGIVGYAGSGTVLKGCVNNLAVSSANEKVAGLVGCAQNGNAKAYGEKGVTIEDCTNTGNVTCTTEKKSRAALLVTYTDSKVTFKGTIIAQGTVTQAGSTSNIQSIINISSGSAVVADGAVIKAPAGMKSTIHNNKAHAGLNYATVADGVATFVADSAAVNGANLKVMTTDNTITLANVGDKITLDTTLATATVTTTATDAYVATAGNVYTVTAKADAAFTVSIDPTEAEWTAELTLPTPTITGTTATGSWSPAAITEPDAGTTNTYTYTVTVAATETTKETTKSVEFKVYKNATVVYPDYITDDTAKGKFDTWASDVAKIDGEARKTASMDAYLLNVAPANVDTAKAAFKIVSIEQDAEGAWTVKVTADKKTDGQAYGNGTIEIQGATTLEGPWAKDTAGAKFFKAILK